VHERKNALLKLAGSGGDLRVALGDLKRRLGQIVQKSLQQPIVINRGAQERMPGAFIIAPPRSGTTLLRLLLDSHPAIAAPPETFIFAQILAPLRDRRATGAMWNLGFHRDALALALGDCARRFLEGYAASKHKDFWIEKTPAYVDLLLELREAMPDAKYIMLYRHPFDIVRSMTERNMVVSQPEIARHRSSHPSDFATYCAFVADQHQKMRAFQRAHPKVCVEMRYERLVGAPEPEIRRVCDFLNVRYVAAMLDFHQAPHDIGFGDEKIHKTTGIEASGRIAIRDREQEIEARKYLSATLSELGYDA
jgi:protein-tyrosine sulfotransferase